MQRWCAGASSRIAVLLAGCAPTLRSADVAAVRADAQTSGVRGDGLRAAQLALVGSARVVGFGTPVAGAAACDGLAVGLFMALVVGRGFLGLALGGETLQPAAAFDAIAAYVHVEPAQCTEDDAPLHKFIGPAK